MFSRTSPLGRRCLPFFSLLFAVVFWFPANQSSIVAAEPLLFERDVRPILKAYCLDCHGAEDKPKAGLDLRLVRFIQKGGESGPSIAVGKPAESLLLERMKSGEMPPSEKKVPADKIAIVEKWIKQGANVGRTEPETLNPGIEITAEERAYWFFQPIRRPSPPQIPNTVTTSEDLKAHPTADLVRTPIDQLVLQKLREKGLRFAPESDRTTLIRRVALDLTGIPPTPAEVAEYLNDQTADAYEKIVDRFLRSPQYGERWGRHWLDVAGYADSEGNGNEDTLRPFSYKYRDYVIRAFNSDKPFDQFVIEQLAGDELVPQPWNNLTPDNIEKLVATGFLRMGADTTATGGPNQDEAANLVVGDMLKIVSTSLLGLSVGCAQCHDHKYDPIPQADYFRLRAIFEPALDTSHWRRPGQRLVSLYTDADRAKAQAVDADAAILQMAFNEKQARFVNDAFEKVLEKFPEGQRDLFRSAYNSPADKRSPEQKKLLDDNPSVNISPGVLYQYNQPAADELKKDQQVIDAKRAEKPPEDFVSVTNELPGVVPVTQLFYRGDYRDRRQALAPGDLTIASPEGTRFDIPEKDPTIPTTGRRLAWARHITNGKHPLFGRVIVNRIWLHHFGRGIVETAGDFGILGTRPTHPELLDYMADEFFQQGWSVKKLHKLILMSHVYRQSSVAFVAESNAGSRAAVDPHKVDTLNTLYWRFPLRRLEAEVLRDRMLSASGRLDLRPFGPPIPVEENFAGQVLTKDDAPRRSVYLQVRRSKPVSFLTTFDAPVMTVNCEKRSSSTGATQSLMLMNNESVLKEAEHFAQRIRKEVSQAPPTPDEAKIVARFPRHASAWQFGYGSFNTESKKTTFTELPHFAGGTWQGGTTLPDAQTGWALVHQNGGHPGDKTHASIRRWVAPSAGIVAIDSALSHESANGDGVIGQIATTRGGIVGEWPVKTGNTPVRIPSVAVEPGDTIDFIVNCGETVESDSYQWTITLKLQPEGGKPAIDWSSSRDFHGPEGVNLPRQVAQAWEIAYLRAISPDEMDLACQFLSDQLQQLRLIGEQSDHELAALTSLCQQLLSSNEFLHVD